MNRLRLRIVIPLILCAFTIIVGLHQTLRRLEQARQERRESGLAELGATLSQLQESLSTHLLENNQTLARQRLATAALAPNIRRLLVADESNRVCLASDSDWLGRSLADHPDYDPGAATAARETRAGRIVPAGLKLLGYFPITLGLNPGEIRPSRAGLLFAEYSLRGPFEKARTNAYRDAVAFCAAFFALSLALAVALHLLVTRRVEKLARAVAAVAGGDLTARARIHGRDEIARLAESFDDMTARLAAGQAELQQTRNDLANVIDSMPAILATIAPDGCVTQWNRAAERFTEIPADRALGRPLTELLPAFAPVIAELRAARDPDQPARVDSCPIARDGETHFYDLMLYPLAAPGAAVVRIEDITQRTRLQALMVQNEKMLSLGNLAAGMAHEINNPLGIIAQAAQNIERRIAPDLPANRATAAELGLDLDRARAYHERRQVPEFLRCIREAASRAARIVSSMLRFSRPQSNAARVPTDLAELVDQTLELAANDYDLKKRFDFRGIEIVRAYDDRLPPVPVVPVEIQQVILNLLKNAAQAMDGAPDPSRRPRIVLRTRRLPEAAVCEVEDNGPGLSAEARPRLFEPFFTTKPPGVGTGLGLYVSYMIIVGNHGGRISVEPAPEGGARFIIQLPYGKESGA